MRRNRHADQRLTDLARSRPGHLGRRGDADWWRIERRLLAHRRWVDPYGTAVHVARIWPAWRTSVVSLSRKGSRAGPGDDLPCPAAGSRTSRRRGASCAAGRSPAQAARRQHGAPHHTRQPAQLSRTARCRESAVRVIRGDKTAGLHRHGSGCPDDNGARESQLSITLPRA